MLAPLIHAARNTEKTNKQQNRIKGLTCLPKCYLICIQTLVGTVLYFVLRCHKNTQILESIAAIAPQGKLHIF